MQEIHVKEFDLMLDFKIKPGKRGWSIRFHKPNCIEFISPKSLTIEEIELELSKHYRFIKRCMNQQMSIYNESIHLFGIEYELRTIESNMHKLLLLGDKVYLYTDTEDKSINQKIVNEFYKENLSYFVNENIDKVKKDLKIDFPVSIEYKQVKTFYGECFFKKRKIIFQESLAKYDKIYILSVIYHEFAHFYYQNHQEGFYTLLESVFPGYKTIQSKLRKTKYNDIY